MVPVKSQKSQLLCAYYCRFLHVAQVPDLGTREYSFDPHWLQCFLLSLAAGANGDAAHHHRLHLHCDCIQLLQEVLHTGRRRSSRPQVPQHALGTVSYSHSLGGFLREPSTGLLRSSESITLISPQDLARKLTSQNLRSHNMVA